MSCVVLSRLEHNILINVKWNPKSFKTLGTYIPWVWTMGGSLAGKLVLLEWYKTLFRSSFMPLCIGIPVGMARLSVVARLILVYGWLPSPFLSFWGYFTLPVRSYFLLICESRVVSSVESCLHVYLFIIWLLHVDYLICRVKHVRIECYSSLFVLSFCWLRASCLLVMAFALMTPWWSINCICVVGE